MSLKGTHIEESSPLLKEPRVLGTGQCCRHAGLLASWQSAGLFHMQSPAKAAEEGSRASDCLQDSVISSGECTGSYTDDITISTELESGQLGLLLLSPAV